MKRLSLREHMIQIVMEAYPGMVYATSRTDRPFPLVRDTSIDLVNGEAMMDHRQNYMDFNDYYEKYDEEAFDYSECEVAPFKTYEAHKAHIEANYEAVYAKDLGEMILTGMDRYLQWEIDQNDYDILEDARGYVTS